MYGQIIDFLTFMHDWLTPEGRWCQHESYEWNPSAGYNDLSNVLSACLIGASAIACEAVCSAHDYHADKSALRAIERQIANSDDVIGWNDAPERTQEDVLLLIKQAIADVETAQGNLLERPG